MRSAEKGGGGEAGAQSSAGEIESESAPPRAVPATPRYALTYT
jgi:hypothetical protein